ncbi:MAG: MFS transporter [Candidatus Sumerlaeota bacterium]|nr:MFS transporter [Candidatus Sumerlaeota bacterium]
MKIWLVDRLRIMMFLQYAVWGAWTPIFAADLSSTLGLSGHQVALVYSLLWAACIIAPFVGGQIADRWVPTQWFLALAHLIGGLAFLWMAQRPAYPSILIGMGVWALFYAPTLALTNSLAFRHLPNSEKEFGFIRVFGTLGWIVAGLLLAYLRKQPTLFHGAFHKNPLDSILLAGVCQIVLAVFCLLLPHTPPIKSTESPFAFLKAIRMLRLVPGFLAFLLISFVMTTELQFYYVTTAPFLQDLGLPREQLSAWMTIAQNSEMIGMYVLLPLLLPLIGIRWSLFLGAIAWPLRYAFFATGHPLWLVLAALSLHGIGYTFFFVVSQIYVDKVAPRDIRASAQSLLTFVTLGLGNLLGTFFTGWIWDLFTVNGVTRWSVVFCVPLALTLVCAVAFVFTFKEPKGREANAA